jgi:hypothetical protein
LQRLEGFSNLNSAQDHHRSLSSGSHGTGPVEYENHIRSSPVDATPHDEGAVDQAPRRDHGDETVYGSSSNISFLRQVANAAELPKSTGDVVIDEDISKKPMLLGFSTTQPPSPQLPHGHTMFVLPERWLADSLLQSFWDLVHPVFPIIHRPSFETRYVKLWEPSITEQDFNSAVFQATLSIVLALGAQRSELRSAEQRSGQFYQQSCDIISIDALDQSSLQVLQALLLRGLYLHYTSHADRCWNTVGVALRVAQGLGLHTRREDSSTGGNQLQSEMKRRVWYCCVTLDRYCSLFPINMLDCPQA